MAAAIKIESYQKTNTKVNYISVKFLPLNATPLGVNLFRLWNRKMKEKNHYYNPLIL